MNPCTFKGQRRETTPVRIVAIPATTFRIVNIMGCNSSKRFLVVGE
jgi:hypothetical protein